MQRFRHFVQAFFAAATNSYLMGFASGRVFGGHAKAFCVPGMNCYSCPGAWFSCPIGALQAVLGQRSFLFSCYVFGFLMLIGGLFGRFVCGWLCPFGLIQDLLHKIPLPKRWKMRTFPGDRTLRFLKYVLLVGFVVLLPLLIVDIAGQGAPWFCKWICPVGTLEGGIPLLLANESLRAGLGFLFHWKFAILVVILLLSVVLYRPFCKYLCPLGAIYGLFNRFSLFRVQPAPVCRECKMCAKPNDTECIRCAGTPFSRKNQKRK